MLLINIVMRWVRHMMLAAAVVPAGALGAETIPPAPGSVIELFTSQGCSSCPAADRLAAELALRPEFLVLSFPVDYWDYLGWKDTLAKHEFTDRQRAYALQRGDRQVYTPQMVVNGMTHAVGSDRSEISAHSLRNRPSIAVAITGQDGAYKASIVSKPGMSGTVSMMSILRSRSVTVGRGENHGAILTYTNVVRGLLKLGDWKGEATSYEIPVSFLKSADGDTFAIVVQTFTNGQPGQILGAAKGPGL